MNYAEVLEALNQASAFQLYRLRAAIDLALRDPARNAAVRRHLILGQSIDYFDTRENRMREGRLVEMRQTKVVVLDREENTRYILDYAALNLEGSDAVIRQTTERGIGRQEIAVGDQVGFQDRDGRPCHGKVTRLNGKTATVECDGVPWRVSYALLHRTLEASP